MDDMSLKVWCIEYWSEVMKETHKTVELRHRENLEKAKVLYYKMNEDWSINLTNKYLSAEDACLLLVKRSKANGFDTLHNVLTHSYFDVDKERSMVTIKLGLGHIKTDEKYLQFIQNWSANIVEFLRTHTGNKDFNVVFIRPE